MKSSGSLIRNLILENVLKYKYVFIFILIALIAITAINASLPMLFSRLVVRDKADVVSYLFALLISLVVVKLIVQYFLNYATHHLSNLFPQEVRVSIIHNIVDTDYLALNSFKTGDLFQTIFSEINEVIGKLVFGVIYFIKDVVFIVILLILILSISPVILGTTTVLILLFTVFWRMAWSRVESNNKKYRFQSSELFSLFGEVLRGKKDIIVYNIQDSIKQKVNDFSKTINLTQRSLAKITSLYGVIIELFVITFLASSFLILWNTKISSSEIIQLVSYFLMLVWPIKEVNTFCSSIFTIKPSLNRLDKLLEEIRDKRTVSPTAATRVVQSGDQVSFDLKHITFNYPGSDEEIMRRFQYSFTKGMYLITGRNGAGKSTLMEIMAGLIHPTSGGIATSLTAQTISLIQQEVFLFNETVLFNLLIVNPRISKREINDVISSYGLDFFYRDLPKGLDTVVGENGCQLSGGQKQIVNILRGLLVNPDVLLLDEFTNSLNKNVYMHLMQKIKRERSGKITIVVSHQEMDNALFDAVIPL